MTFAFVGIDHIQIAAPIGGEPAARRFFVDLLGLVEVPKPEPLASRGGCWFVCGAQQIHIGVEKDFRPAKKAHPALRLVSRAAAEALRKRLEDAGVPVEIDSEIPTTYRFFAEDPFGNRIELCADS